MKAGNKVIVTDYSYSRTINEKGELVSGGWPINNPPENFIVEAVNCSLPTGCNNGGYKNNTILRELNSHRILFICSSFLTVMPKTETRMIGHVQMMQALLDRGFKQLDDGLWISGTISIRRDIFRFCGKTKDDNMCFSDWLFEEVEV